MVSAIYFQYDEGITHYPSTAMDGHPASMYPDPHAHSRSMTTHLSHSPGLNHAGSGLQSHYSSAYSSSSSMVGMNSSPQDSQMKRDKDQIYG